MTVEEANQILMELFSKPSVLEEDEPLFIECLTFLADTTNDGEAMYYLGDYYYQKDRPELALKYWEMSGVNGFAAGWAGLGDFYFFGKAAAIDYKKAFYYFSKGSEAGNIYCKYKLADMYRDGLYVKADKNKYKQIIEELYYQYSSESGRRDPMIPDITFRLARIYAEEGQNDKAVMFYRETTRRYKSVIKNRFYADYASAFVYLLT